MKSGLLEPKCHRPSTDRHSRAALRMLCVATLAFLTFAAGVSTASADGVKTFNIEQQTLSSALNEFARQSDRQILFSADIVRSKKARSIKGDLEPEAALRLLLKGTGLIFRVTPDNTILVEAAGAGGDTANVPVSSQSVRVAQAGGVTSASRSTTAATVSAEEASGREPIGEVTVTGSRIAQRDYSANSPITTLSAAAINSTGAVTLESALDTFPQFTVGSGPTTTGFFASGQATLNMRGLGSVRNLVLLDGRRIQPSNSQQVVDINTIPKALIESVEIITGGASAVYGSDAIAGVVNFKTRKNFQGIQLDAQVSPTQHYGGMPKDFALTAGGNFGDNRGNAVVSISYTQRGPIGFLDLPFYRTWAGAGDFRTGEGTYNPAANRPSQTAINNVFGSYGVAAPPASSFLGFNSDGTLFAATNGLGNYKGGLGLQPSTSGTSIAYTNISSIVQTPLDRYTAFARATYEITPDIEGFVQAQFVDYKSQTVAEAGNTTLSIPVTNPFIPADLATLLASRANPNAAFSLEKRFYEAGPRIFNRKFDTYQVIGGLSGSLSIVDGTWEAYASHGSMNVTQTNPGSVIGSALTTLLNASDGGASICSGGYNPFGLTTLSPQCRTYLTRVPLQTTNLTQDVAEANVQGHIIDLPAGGLRFAVGLDYIGDKFDYSPDGDIALGTIVGVPQSGASSGSTHVIEGYAELLVPVLADLPLVRKFDVDLAYRRSKYNLSGSVNTYKADANWTVVPAFRLRGGYQRAVRAPNVGELFTAPTAGFAGIGEITAGGGDPCASNSSARTGANAAQIQALCVAQGVPAGLIGSFTNAQNEIPSTNVGNVDLKPESADTYTVGAVLNAPSDRPLLSGLQLSVDYYNISIEGVVGVISGLQSLNKCYNLDGSNPTYSASNFYCGLMTRDTTTGSLTSVLQRTLNLGSYKTSGVDLQADWRVGLDAFGLSPSAGSVGFNSVVSRLVSFKVQNQPGGAFADYSNTVGASTNGGIGSLPNWKTTTSASYQLGSWTAGLRWRFIGRMRSLAKVSNPNSTTPDTPSNSLFDLFGNWSVNDHLSVNGGVNNLLDRDPPIMGGVAGTTEPSTYDILGRTFYVAARVTL